MKDLVNKTMKYIKQASYKKNKSILIAAMFIGVFLERNGSLLTSFIVTLLLAVIILGYIAISIKRKESGLIMFYFTVELFVIDLIASNYLKMKGMNDDNLVIAIPILLILFLITNYIHVKKIGNKKQIRKVKNNSMILILLLVIIFLFLVYFHYFH